MTGSPRESCRAFIGSSSRDAACRARHRVQALAADDLAVADQRHQQRPVVAVVDRRLADPDHLGLGDAAGVAAGAARTSGRRSEILSLLFFATSTIRAVRSPSRATSL